MRTIVKTTQAPQPMGPFSQAIVAGNLVFVSAQLSQVPATDEMINDTIEAETAQVMNNIKAILMEAGVDFSKVVKASIFLKDMQDYAKMNAVYSSYFEEPFPARETIQVAGLPLDVNIEISVIAVKDL